MGNNEQMLERLTAILREIEALPKGGITYKTINGHKYAYYQWREDGKQRSRRAKDHELDELSQQIERRKELEFRLKEESREYSASAYSKKNVSTPGYSFRCSVRTGSELDAFVKSASEWKKRACFSQINDYIYSEPDDRIHILYGLRRTGKTTLIRQAINDMKPDDRSRTAFIQIHSGSRLADVNSDIRYLEKKGFKYIFIDEVTLLDDFIEDAALFSDIFASSGMKIILSGTDSLGFMFAEDNQLYDRCSMTHTTFIPYAEFERVLGINGIDEYIRYGGTMSPGGINYNKDRGIFTDKKGTDEYVDRAIAHNIQHSLKNYSYEGHFRSLRELYEKNELTNVINRVIEDINHRFTLEVLTKDFRSNDLRISAGNLRKDRANPSDILDRIDFDRVNTVLMSLLEIRNKDTLSVVITDAHRKEIKEYLDILDLTVDIEIRNMTDFNIIEYRTAFSQPGMRYSQAEALIKSLLNDNEFRNLSFKERKSVTARILSEIKGRMMEDIVLLETRFARKNCEVFRLQFSVGEFDMVVADYDQGTCEIYEIKHSSEAVPSQYRHLADIKKCDETEFRYGEITGRYVIYSGEACEFNTDNGYIISYLNVEEYLKSLQNIF